VISAVLTILTTYAAPGFEELQGHNAAFWTGLLGSAALWATVAGRLLFGFLGDRLGRKYLYGVEAAILVAGALLSAIAPNLLWLIAARTFLGFGIGGDYPISATIMSEYSNVRDRGKLVALVFANQGLGILASVGVALASVAWLPPDVAWRVMLGVGAIPAASVIYFRRKMPETPRFALLVKGDVEEAKKAAGLFGADITAPAKVEGLSLHDFLSNNWKILVGTTVPWFLTDMVVSSIMGQAKSIFQQILYQGLPFMVGFPGYFVAAFLLDRLGRKPIQNLGFAAMAVIYLAVSAVVLQAGKSVELLIPGRRSPVGILAQLLLHKLRPQHHDLRDARRGLPHPLQDDRPRHIGRRRQARRGHIHPVLPDAPIGHRGIPPPAAAGVGQRIGHTFHGAYAPRAQVGQPGGDKRRT